jgi:hypothetical protein
MAKADLSVGIDRHVTPRCARSAQRAAAQRACSTRLPRSKVPTGALVRVVARFCATTGGQSKDEEAVIRVVPDAITVHSGRIQAQTSADGLRFRAGWPMAEL